MADSRLRIFGALEIVHGDGAPQHPSGERVIALLGYLAVNHDRPQRRDGLINTLWPDLDEDAGRRVLSDTLWRVRRLLSHPGGRAATALHASGNTITLSSGGELWIDLVSFKEQLACAEVNEGHQAAAHLAAAVELYRSDLLVDCEDGWLAPERTSAEVGYFRALRRLLQYYQELRAYEQALPIALRLVGLEPDEELYRELMRLLYLLGREDDALRAFEECRTEFSDRLEPATLALRDEIVALQQRRAGSGAVVSEGKPGAQPNATELPFVGRAPQRAVLLEAVELVIAGAGGTLLLAGVAGMGKSRLLREVAVAASWRGAEIVWGHAHEGTQALPFAPLREALGAALTPLRIQQIAQVVPAAQLRRLGPLLPQLAAGLATSSPAAQPAERQTALLHEALIELLRALSTIAPHVLILEDVHWFDPATLTALAALQPALNDTRVLLLLSGRADELPQRPAVWSAIQQLDRLGAFQWVDLDSLSEVDCAQLVRRALRFGSVDDRFAAQLHALTGGNPFFVLEVLRGLQEQGLLSSERHGQWQLPWGMGERLAGRELPRSLRSAIGERVAKLPAEAHALLCAAAVLDQEFMPATVATMLARSRAANDAGSSDISPGRLFALLHNLVQRQFLVETATSYRFAHDTIREQLYKSLEADQRRELHLRAAEALEVELVPPVEHLAQQFALAEVWERAFPYLVQAGDKAMTVQALQEARGYYQRALAAADQAQAVAAPALRAELQLRLGRVATALADYQAAADAYLAALALTEPAADEADKAVNVAVRIQALNGLSAISGLRSEYGDAERYNKCALRLANEYASAREQADVQVQAGELSFRMDDFAQALRQFHKALTLYEQLGMERDRAVCLQHIGACHLRQEGPTDRVITCYSRALEIYQQQEDGFAEHQCQLEIANTCLTRGRPAQVLSMAQRCQQFFGRVGALDEVAWSLFLRGEASRRLGDSKDARAALHDSMTISARLRRDAASRFSQIHLAATLRDIGAFNEALELLQPALVAEDRSTVVRALLIAVEIFIGQDQPELALSSLKRAFQLAEILGAKARVGIAYRLLAELQLRDWIPPEEQEEFPSAEASLLRSQSLLGEALYEDELAQTTVAYSRLLMQQRRVGEAKAQLIRARVLFWRCCMPLMLARVGELLAPLVTVRPALLPFQRVVTLARREAPRGRLLRADELVDIVWTVEDSNAVRVGRSETQAASRRERLRLLCDEAAAQGAEPTVLDLSEALGVSAKTVQRDIAALRAAGEPIATRGIE